MTVTSAPTLSLLPRNTRDQLPTRPGPSPKSRSRSDALKCNIPTTRVSVNPSHHFYFISLSLSLSLSVCVCVCVCFGISRHRRKRTTRSCFKNSHNARKLSCPSSRRTRRHWWSRCKAPLSLIGLSTLLGAPVCVCVCVCVYARACGSTNDPNSFN